jgi:Ca2+/Na+ antiporter
MKATVDNGIRSGSKHSRRGNRNDRPPGNNDLKQKQVQDASPDGRLRLLGARQAQSWEAPIDKKNVNRVKRRWASFQRLSLKAWTSSKSDIQRKGTSAENQRWILENARFLHGIANVVQEAVKSFRRLPSVPASGEQNDAVPRAYEIAAGFLAVTGLTFTQEMFGSYLTGIQQVIALEMRELWALKPLLQLVLLEQLRAAAAPSAEAYESPDNYPVPSPARPSVVIESLREISQAEWKDFFEAHCIVNRILRADPSGAYGSMDYDSRQLYRDQVSALARHSSMAEVEIARWAVFFARQARRQRPGANPRIQQRRSNVGYFLLDSGLPALRRAIGYRPSLLGRIRNIILEWPEVYYVVGVEFTTLVMVFLLLRHLGFLIPLIPGVLLLIPASQAAVGLMNYLTASLIPPRRLPRLDFSRGIPPEFRTLVVVPSLLLNEKEVHHIVESLEVRYLGNRGPNLHFALLTDVPDTPTPSTKHDELVHLCNTLVDDLNSKYAHHQQSCFFHLHRHHVFNPQENVWMGWERKRGKLLDLNKLLLNAEDNFPVKAGDLSVLHDVRYVITLDSDTRLPRDTAHKLVGTLAHPLNRAVIDPTTNTVVEGHAILQPRVGISTESVHKSRLASIYSGETGIDVYTRAVSDVYQDLFGEGSFTGKGIYEVKTFHRVLGKRFPTNALLSHDLIEGAYARAGLASDIEVIDDYPSHSSAYCRRMHRWVRGDWQILRWLLPQVPDFFGRWVHNPLTLLSRWKIFDNLRRSLIELNLFLLLIAGWFMFPGSPFYWTLVILALLLTPAYVRTFFSLPCVITAKDRKAFIKEHTSNFLTGHLQVFVMLVFLPHRAFVMADAIVRALTRTTLTHRNLLEWETAAEAESGTRKKSAIEAYLKMTPWFALAIGLLLAALRPSAIFAAAPLLALWLAADVFTRWIDRPPRKRKTIMNSRDTPFLRHATLATWRYFREFSTDQDNWLVPDRVQEAPAALVHSISPTNLGLLLNARVAARHLGYLTLPEFVEHTEATIQSAKGLPRYRGHFLNWYHTQTLEPLPPRFVSTVDSGNLAACLLTLKQACLGMGKEPLLPPDTWQGVRDHISLVEELVTGKVLPVDVVASVQKLSQAVENIEDSPLDWVSALPLLEHHAQEALEALRPVAADELRPQPNTVTELAWWLGETRARIERLNTLVQTLTPWLLSEYRQLAPAVPAESLSLISLPGVIAAVEDHLIDLPTFDDDGPSPEAIQAFRSHLQASLLNATELTERLQQLAAVAGELFEAMDFRFLFDPSRKLLRVGYDVETRELAKSYYDLLASEARTATFVAIAKGDIEQEAWFHLGRAQTRAHDEAPLVSWSGTLFEYLMPVLWMRSFRGTLLDQGMSSAVACQRQHTKKRGVPWGVSEAAFSDRDSKGIYQYYAFGLPKLALNPGASRDLVVAPYASFLALMVDASAAVQNLKCMKEKGWLGRFGFYEAVDYSKPDLSESQEYTLIRCWMAHHQGMSLLAACNLLAQSSIQRWFHTDPLVMATELLLHERASLATPDAPLPASPVQSILQVRGHDTSTPEGGPKQRELFKNGTRTTAPGAEVSSQPRLVGLRLGEEAETSYPQT